MKKALLAMMIIASCSFALIGCGSDKVLIANQGTSNSSGSSVSVSTPNNQEGSQVQSQGTSVSIPSAAPDTITVPKIKNTTDVKAELSKTAESLDKLMNSLDNGIGIDLSNM